MRVTEPSNDRYTAIRPLLRESFYDTMENPLVTHSNGDITSDRGLSWITPRNDVVEYRTDAMSL